MPNRLAGETSPYLLQHADNPVDWYPWGEEALAEREAKTPILLSIGYAACHWCHVMAHESFENEETAQLMNELFVNIKVDREERPDLDGIYMQAVQAMTGHGGWPMTVFLTPEGVPFYGGTYYPPRIATECRRFGASSHPSPTPMRNDATRLPTPPSSSAQIYDAASCARAERRRCSRRTRSTSRIADSRAAATTSATAASAERPKFPPTMVARFPAALLEAHRNRRTRSRWSRNRSGRWRAAGMYDQIGGGFHRYTVDGDLARSALREDALRQRASHRLGANLWQATQDAEVRRVTTETIDWVSTRDDIARRRFLLFPRRGQRRTRGQVLRLVGS